MLITVIHETYDQLAENVFFNRGIYYDNKK